MKLTYLVPTFDQVCDTTLWMFDDNSVIPDWLDCIFSAYPILDKGKVFSMPWEKRRRYLKEKFKKIYQETIPLFKEKADQWNTYFNSHATTLAETFGKIFNVDATKVLNDITGYPNLNPICPRYIDEHSFYIDYSMPNEYVFLSSVHEIIHFFWFYKWQEYFHDNPKEYNTPHLKWIYSEMLIDTFTRHSDLKKFFPDKYQSAYDCFYHLQINGQDALPIFADIYKNAGLKGLFTTGFDIMKKNEEEIRSALNKITNSSCWDPPALAQ